MENLAPILLFVYNRPEHTGKTLDALAQNKEAESSVLYIYCDGAKPNATVEEQNKINAVRKLVAQENRFRQVIIHTKQENSGLAASIIFGVSEILEKNEKVIVLEDDLVTSPYFLGFMNEALLLYESDSEVACISGYAYPVKSNMPATYFIKGTDCWGWATWKRAWQVFEPTGTILLKELKSKKLSHAFDFDSGYPFTQMLIDQIEGRNNSWAIRWHASAYLKDMLCLYPGESLVHNIGIDGSGTHTVADSNFDTILATKATSVVRLELKENLLARKELVRYFHRIKKKNNSLIRRIKNKIKSIFSR